MYFTSAAHKIATTSDSDRIPSQIHADELTEGDTIRHFTGDTWLVISEPKYTNAGITFDVMWLDVDSPDNIQSVCFSPHWRLQLVTHQSASQIQNTAA